MFYNLALVRCARQPKPRFQNYFQNLASNKRLNHQVIVQSSSSRHCDLLIIITRGKLLSLNALKQSLEVTLSKTVIALALNKLEKNWANRSF